MIPVLKPSLAQHCAAFAAGWATLVALNAGYDFALPHDEHFAPEVGRFGAFIFFSALSTFFYVIACAAITPLSQLPRFRILSPSPHIAAMRGVVAYACIAPLVSFLFGWSKPNDLLLIAGFLSVSGGVAFYILSRLSTRVATR